MFRTLGRSNIWFTSDTHFGHNKDFIYKPRSFNNIQEHDEVIIENWNSIVQPRDIVYHLGDTIMGRDREYGLECMRRLNGFIYLVGGNHDTFNKQKELINECGVIYLGHAAKIKISKRLSFFLCHYPVLTAPVDAAGNIHSTLYSLCGHTHTKNKFIDWDKGGIYHVELDAHSCYPVAIEDIRKDIFNHN